MKRLLFGGLAAAATLIAFAIVAAGASASPPALGAGTQFYVPPPEPAAQDQIGQLNGAGDKTDAALVRGMASTPHAVWIDGGTPAAAHDTALSTVNRAAGKNEMPVLALYNIPGRDCSGFSAGGATDLASYEAWINGIAAGIGNKPVMIILEPDSLGLLPGSNCGFAPGTGLTDANRFAELNYAVDKLGADGAARVYLDGTHSAWLNTGDISQRLVEAGVQHAAGFYLNISNYQYASNEVFYGTWISDCITYATQVKPGDYADCPNQYWSGGPANNFQAGEALSPYKVWQDTSLADNPDLTSNTVGIDGHWAQLLGSVQPTTHFVVDTSRDGNGPWDFASAGFPDSGTAQDWCNPPGRGNGMRPTANTGSPLVDAFLWVKVPGESDGSCNRGTTGATDPEWGGIVDPAAGMWFQQQALQLARLAITP